MTRQEAVNHILTSGGRWVSIEFRKRTDNSLRQMNGRIGVKAHVKGPLQRDWDGTPVVTALDHTKGLILLWDAQKEGYRSVPVEGLTRVKVNDTWQLIEG